MSDVSEEQKELFAQIIVEVKQQVAEFEDKELSRRTLGDFWFKRAEDDVKRLEDMDTFINFRRYNLLVFDLPYIPDYKINSNKVFPSVTVKLYGGQTIVLEKGCLFFVMWLAQKLPELSLPPEIIVYDSLD